MDKLYAPWRDRYVQQAIKSEKTQDCVFCALFDGKESDQERFVLWKDQNLVIVLNLYPYNGGHLLIISKKHAAELYDLSQEVQAHLMYAVTASAKIVKNVLACDGINFGANFGRAAGAGIPDHLHLHIVPRFSGDIGFFTTIGDTKQVSVDLEKIYKKLKPYFDTNILG